MILTVLLSAVPILLKSLVVYEIEYLTTKTLP